MSRVHHLNTRKIFSTNKKTVSHLILLIKKLYFIIYYITTPFCDNFVLISQIAFACFGVIIFIVLQ